jgi:hypothetical protein
LAEVRRVHQAEVQLQLLVTLLYRRMRDEATRRTHAHESKQVLYSFNCWPQMAVKDQRIAKLEEEVAAAEAERQMSWESDGVVATEHHTKFENAYYHIYGEYE